MAEETTPETPSPESGEKQGVPPPQQRNTGVADSTIPGAYANNSQINLGPSEIAITFFRDFDLAHEETQPIIRIEMTHAVFISFVTYCNRYAKLLGDLYDGRPKTLIDINNEQPERADKAVQDHLHKRFVDVRFTYADDDAEQAGGQKE